MKATLPKMFALHGGFCLVVVVTFLSGCDRGFQKTSSQHEKLEHFDGAIDSSDSTFDAAKSNLYVRASQFLHDGDLDAATSLYRKAIEKYPNDPEGFAALGACLYFEHNYDDARTQYLRALEVDGQCLTAHYGLGCVAYEQKQYDQAIQHFKQALDMDASNSDCHRMLGMVFDATGDRLQAIFHYERAIALNGRDDATAEMLRRLKQ